MDNDGSRMNEKGQVCMFASSNTYLIRTNAIMDTLPLSEPSFFCACVNTNQITASDSTIFHEFLEQAWSRLKTLPLKGSRMILVESKQGYWYCSILGPSF